MILPHVSILWYNVTKAKGGTMVVNVPAWLTYISMGFSVIITLFGVLCYSWFTVIKGTNKLLSQQNVELRNSIEQLQNRVKLIEDANGSMTGEIKTLKDIPLLSIDCTLKRILSRIHLPEDELQEHDNPYNG
jgi:hypothetical protein